MIWYWLAGLLAIAALALLVSNYLRQRRYLKKKTSEAMSRNLWGEIEEERFDALTRKQKFSEVMGEAKRQKS